MHTLQGAEYGVVRGAARTYAGCRMSTRATQVEIARRAGLSHATVSRALADSPLISPATKEKVRRVAEELGYRRHAVVSHLMALLRSSRDRSIRSAIAYVTSFPKEEIAGVGRNYLSYYQGALRRAEKLGYHLDVLWRTQPGMTRAKCRTILETRGIRGLIVAPRERPLGHLALDWQVFAGATLGHPMPSPHLHSAMPNHLYNMQLGLRMTGKLGYRRIGLLLTSRQSGYFGKTFGAVMALHNLEAPAGHAVPGFYALDENDPARDAAARQWLARYRPEAILCAGGLADRLVAGAGLESGRDVAIVDLTLTEPDPARAGVWERTAEVGATAVDLVVEQLHHNEIGPPATPKAVLVEGVWAPGASAPARVPPAKPGGKRRRAKRAR